MNIKTRTENILVTPITNNLFNFKFQILELAQQSPSRVSVPELLQQLQMTQNELENIKVGRHSMPF